MDLLTLTLIVRIAAYTTFGVVALDRGRRYLGLAMFSLVVSGLLQYHGLIAYQSIWSMGVVIPLFALVVLRSR